MRNIDIVQCKLYTIHCTCPLYNVHTYLIHFHYFKTADRLLKRNILYLCTYIVHCTITFVLHRFSTKSTQDIGSLANVGLQRSGTFCNNNRRVDRPVLKRSGSSLQRSRSNLQRSGSNLQRSGSSLQRSGSSMNRSGSSLQRSGSNLSGKIKKIYFINCLL